MIRDQARLAMWLAGPFCENQLQLPAGL